MFWYNFISTKFLIIIQNFIQKNRWKFEIRKDGARTSTYNSQDVALFLQVVQKQAPDQFESNFGSPKPDRKEGIWGSPVYNR